MPSKNTRKPADFLAAAKSATKSEPVALPTLGRTVYVRALSAAAMRALLDANLRSGKQHGDDDAYDNEALEYQMLAAMLFDADGKRLVPEDRAAELAEISNADYSALQTAVSRVNGTGADQGNA